MRWSLVALIAVAGCNQPKPAAPPVSIGASWFTDAPGGTRGYQFIEFTSEEAGGRRWHGAIVLHTHRNRVTLMDSRGTLKIDDREVKLPEPDGRVYVLDPSFGLHRVDLKAEDVRSQVASGKLEQFFASEDWTKRLGPVLKQHEWPPP
jgi:hypothetical protein